MLEFIIGFLLGYWVACNQEEVKVYWENIKNWIKETKENYINKENNENNQSNN